MIFLDVYIIDAGSNFRESAKRFIDMSRVVLVLIGENWLDTNSQRRINLPEDPVRVEIETALNTDKTIIPVLVRQARMPQKAALPASIACMVDKAASRVRPDPDFDADMRKLRAALQNCYPEEQVFHMITSRMNTEMLPPELKG